MTGLLVGLPLIGALLSDNPIDQYLEFPPLTRYIVHQPFSKFAFILFFVITATPVAGLAYLIKLSKSASSTINNIARFPWWGWLAGITLAIVWFLAWTRYAWFGSLQAYTFTPLWAAFIVLINAVTYTNRGQCLLTHQPKLLLWLFPASSLFWWLRV